MKKGYLHTIALFIILLLCSMTRAFALPTLPHIKNATGHSWYFTGKIETTDGTLYGVCIMFIEATRHILGISYHIPVVISQLVNIKTHQLFLGEHSYLFTRSPFVLKPLNLTLKGKGFLKANTDHTRYNLQLDLKTIQHIRIAQHIAMHALTKPLPVQANGLIHLGGTEKLTYTIQPTIKIKGTLTINRIKKTINPKKSALWLEVNHTKITHANHVKWVWFAIRLKNGARLLVVRLGYGTHKPLDIINLLTPNHHWENLSDSKLTITTDTSIPFSHGYAQGFYVTIHGPTFNMTSHIISRSPNQINVFTMDALSRITGRINGQAIKGYAGMDLCHLNGTQRAYFYKR
jgi:hypothetical protein